MTTPTDNQDECRKAFEKWADTAGYDTEAVDLCDRVDGRFYQSLDAQVQWTAWQAAWNRSKPPADGDMVERVAKAIYPEYMEWVGVEKYPVWEQTFDSFKGPCLCIAKAALASLSNGSEPVGEMDTHLKALQHEYDSTRGLWCIDRCPKEVDYEWIKQNAFQLEHYITETDHPQPNGSATGEGVEKCPDCGADMIEVCSGLEKISRPDAGGGCIF